MRLSSRFLSRPEAPLPAPQVAVLGAGAWGTALAAALQRGGCDVTLWARDPRLAATLASTGSNPRHLPGVRLPRGLQSSANLAAAVAAAQGVIIAVPSGAVPAVARQLAPVLPSGTWVLSAAKGLTDTGDVLTTALARECRAAAGAVGAIAGPSFADEFARGEPACLALGWHSPSAAARRASADLQRWLADAGVELVVEDDAIGLQLAGVMKNVIALACGLAQGLGLGENARAALVCRGLADLRRLTAACGGRADTLFGPAGVGDLFLTASSAQSRNTRLGQKLARGMRPDGGELAEGAGSAERLAKLEHRLGLPLLVPAAVRAVLRGQMAPGHAVEIMLRGEVPVASAAKGASGGAMQAAGQVQPLVAQPA